MKQATIMSRSHLRWDEFAERLQGKEGCNFREENGVGTWDCDGDGQGLAVAILVDMGDIDIPGTQRYFDEHGGYCDCEIVFNIVLHDRPVVEAVG